MTPPRKFPKGAILLAITRPKRNLGLAPATKQFLGKPPQRAQRFCPAIGLSAGSRLSIAIARNRQFVLPIARIPVDPPREHEPLDPERLVEIVASNAPVSLARVNHHAPAFVDADVRDQRPSGIRRKEDQVAALKAAADSVTYLRLADGTSRKFDTMFLKDILCQSRAVKRPGAFRAPNVRATNQTRGKVNDISRRAAGA